MSIRRRAPGRRVARTVAIVGTVFAVGFGATGAQASGPPVGKRLNCYSTYASSGSASGYTSNFQASLVLSRRGSIRYQVTSGGIIRNTVRDHVSWTYSNAVLRFRHGFFARGGRVVGRVSAGATMPHSQLTPARYTVVLRSAGAPASDAMPPRREGTDFRRASYWYCTTSKPTFAPTAPASGPAPAPADPGSTPAPAPAPAPTGPHPPYGTYACVDRYGYATSRFSLDDPFAYHEQNTATGSFTFDEGSGRVDFHGGQYDNESVHWHFYGTYTAPGTIVLAAKTQGTYGGPDADEAAGHTLWHCTLG